MPLKNIFRDWIYRVVAKTEVSSLQQLFPFSRLIRAGNFLFFFLFIKETQAARTNGEAFLNRSSEERSRRESGSAKAAKKRASNAYPEITFPAISVTQIEPPTQIATHATVALHFQWHPFSRRFKRKLLPPSPKQNQAKRRKQKQKRKDEEERCKTRDVSFNFEKENTPTSSLLLFFNYSRIALSDKIWLFAGKFHSKAKWQFETTFWIASANSLVFIWKNNSEATSSWSNKSLHFNYVKSLERSDKRYSDKSWYSGIGKYKMQNEMGN